MTPLAPVRPLLSPAALLAAVALFAVWVIVAPFLTRWLCRLWGLEKPNFRGERVPAAAGLTPLLVAGAAYAALSAVPVGVPLAPAGSSPPPLTPFTAAPIFLLVAVGFGLLGLVDDLWGNRAVGGFRGHLRSLVSARPTTGAVKLIGGGLVALAASWCVSGAGFALHPAGSALRILLDGAIIALGANALNLLDTRPGRAQAGFALLLVPTLVALVAPGWGWLIAHPSPAILIGAVALAALTEWWPDSAGRAMLGDTGANLLGATAALAAVFALPLGGHFFLFAALLGLNWAAEKVSLSAVIARTGWLRGLDSLLGVRSDRT